MASLGHAVVGDALYGAPREMRARRGRATDEGSAISLPRNFLHAAQLELTHPRTGKQIALQSPLPAELQAFLATIEKDGVDGGFADEACKLVGARVEAPRGWQIIISIPMESLGIRLIASLRHRSPAVGGKRNCTVGGSNFAAQPSGGSCCSRSNIRCSGFATRGRAATNASASTHRPPPPGRSRNLPMQPLRPTAKRSPSSACAPTK